MTENQSRAEDLLSVRDVIARAVLVIGLIGAALAALVAAPLA